MTKLDYLLTFSKSMFLVSGTMALYSVLKNNQYRMNSLECRVTKLENSIAIILRSSK